jgi:hypothetical protein
MRHPRKPTADLKTRTVTARLTLTCTEPMEDLTAITRAFIAIQSSERVLTKLSFDSWRLDDVEARQPTPRAVRRRNVRDA